MQNSVSAHFRTKTVLVGLTLLLFTSPLSAQKKATPPREQIGEVFGKPVYRDEIPTRANQELHDKLQWLFYIPVMEKYFTNHKSKFGLTKKEVASATAYFSKNDKHIEREEFLFRAKLKKIDEQLKQPGITADDKRRLKQKKRKIQLEYKEDSIMSFLLTGAECQKIELYLYKNYGGGRIRYMMMGAEAFDATHKWLEDQEKKGHFKITDPQLRTAFYQHWTDKVNVGRIANDQEYARRSLLKPDWAPKPAAKK